MIFKCLHFIGAKKGVPIANKCSLWRSLSDAWGLVTYLYGKQGTVSVNRLEPQRLLT